VNRRDNSNNQLPFNTMEERILREKLKAPCFFMVIAIVFFSIIYAFLPNNQTVLIFFGLFCFLFFGVLIWWISGYFLDLKNGVKWIVRGKIDDRIMRYFKSGKRANNLLIIDGQKVKVEAFHFDEVRTGDEVEVHWAPKSGTSFSVSMLPGASGPGGSMGASFQRAPRFKNTTPIKEELTVQDKKTLLKTLRSRLLFPVMVLLFVSYLITGLVLSGSGALLIFLFPIPIIFIFLVIKIIKIVGECLGERRAGHKEVSKTILIDKYQFDRAGRGGTRYILVTPSTEISARKKLYHKINPHESISVSISSKSQQLLGITLSSGEYINNA